MKNTVVVSVRLPPKLHQQLKKAAKEDHRSMHSMILSLIEKGVKA